MSSREGYKVESLMSRGLARISGKTYGRQLWARVTLRKSCRCGICDVDLKPSAEAFSPITNGDNRGERICVPCVGRLAIMLEVSATEKAFRDITTGTKPPNMMLHDGNVYARKPDGTVEASPFDERYTNATSEENEKT